MQQQQAGARAAGRSTQQQEHTAKHASTQTGSHSSHDHMTMQQLQKLTLSRRASTAARDHYYVHTYT